MKFIALFLFLILMLNGQTLKLNSYQMTEFHEYGYFEDGKTQKKVTFTSPSKVMLASFILPGLGQYLNDDDIKAIIFVGIEALSWSIYASNNSKGDKRTKTFETVANTDFSRIKYYRAIAEETGFGSDFSTLVGNENFINEEANFNRLKDDPLWITLRDIEQNHAIADGVHMLPETKTQQYYEMIAKYSPFWVGWKNVVLGETTLLGKNGEQILYEHYSNWRDFDDYPGPNFISSYYDIRNSANSFYKKADWAIRGIFINHLISGLEALITSKKRLKTQYASKFYNGEIVPSLTFKYDL